jgi:hypothetical protein
LDRDSAGYGIRPECLKAKLFTKKREENPCFEVLDVLVWGLEASPVAWKPFIEA